MSTPKPYSTIPINISIPLQYTAHKKHFQSLPPVKKNPTYSQMFNKKYIHYNSLQLSLKTNTHNNQLLRLNSRKTTTSLNPCHKLDLQTNINSLVPEADSSARETVTWG